MHRSDVMGNIGEMRRQREVNGRLAFARKQVYLSKNGCPATGGWGASARIFRMVASSNRSEGTARVTGV